MASLPQVIDVPGWIESNKKDFLPPICNKLMRNEQLKIFFVGGPNRRNDYHIELGEEFFYQIKGDMCLEVMEQGRPKSIHIRQGEAFLLPARIPHSPQRQADTIGLVIERERRPSELDGLRFYTEINTASGHQEILYERWFHCIDLGTQLVPIIGEFLESNEHKTGIPSSNSRLIEAPYPDDEKTVLADPISMTKWLERYQAEIEELGKKSLFSNGTENFTTRVNIYGGDFKHPLIKMDDQYETFIWQLIGTSRVQLLDRGDGGHRPSQDSLSSILLIKPGHSLTVDGKQHSGIMLETQSGCFTLVLSMPPTTATGSMMPTTESTNNNNDNRDSRAI